MKEIIAVREVDYCRGYDGGKFIGHFKGSLGEVFKKFKEHWLDGVEEDERDMWEEYMYCDEEEGKFYVGGEEGLAYEGIVEGKYKVYEGGEVDKYGFEKMKDWYGNDVEYE